MLQELFSDKQNQASLTMEEAAELIHADPEALKAFEAAYNYQVLEPMSRLATCLTKPKSQLPAPPMGPLICNRKAEKC